MSFIGYSLENPTTESQFLFRELGIVWRVSTSSDLIEVVKNQIVLGKRTLIICSNIQLYEELLGACPENTITLVVLGDESYSQKVLRSVQRHKSICSILRQYGLRSAKTLTVARETIGLLSDSFPKRFNPLQIFKLFLIGLKSKRQIKKWQRLPKRIMILPLGYTNKFSESFLTFARSIFEVSEAPNSSLLQYCMIGKAHRHNSYSFHGNSGQLQRQVLLDKYRGLQDSDIQESNDRWNGFDDSPLSGFTYVESMAHSIFTLCPPGYTNADTFRYYEALICGSQPVEVDFTLSQMGSADFRPDNQSEVGVCPRLKLIMSGIERVRDFLNEELTLEI